MRQVAVLIPAYKESPDPNERLALDSFRRHLGRHQVVFVCPQSLRMDNYLAYFPWAKCERFANANFVSVRSYSRLLETKMFYARFQEFEYVLICQLDCLIFKDDLAQWCDRKHAYIGPPWGDLNFIGVGKRRWLRCVPGLEQWFPEVGNGGLSLRNVALHIRFAGKYRWLSQMLFWLNEDLFWCGVVGRLERDYRIPSRDEALRFGIEYEPERQLESLDGELPFGCHAWNRYQPEVWLRALERSHSRPSR